MMFPEGTRRRKGFARSTRRAGIRVPRASRSRPTYRSFPPGSRARTGSLGSGRCGSRTGAPIELGDLAGRCRADEAARVATERLARRSTSLERRCREDRCSSSTATRSRTARTTRCRSRCGGSDGGPGNALIGFTNMLLRLWQDERPRAVLVAWDTLDVADLSAHRARGVPERPRVRRRAARAARPASARSSRRPASRAAKEPGYEADDFLAAAAAREEAAGGTALVATSDRDAFQLVTRARRPSCSPCAELRRARIGPAEVRERYGVDPGAGARLHRAARRSVGSDSGRARHRREASRRPARAVRVARRDARRTAGSRPRLTRCACTGASRRWIALRRCRRFRTSLPDWAAGAAHARELGLAGVAGRFEEALRVDVISHAALARAAPPAEPAYPEQPERLAVLHERFPDFVDADAGQRATRSSASTSRATSTRIEAIARGGVARPGHVRERRRTWEAACLAAGLRDPGGRGRRASRSCVRPAITRSRRRRWASASSTTSRSRRATRRRELGLERVAIVDFDVHHGNGTEALFREDPACSWSRSTSGRSGRDSGGPGSSDEGTSTSRSRRARATTSTARRSTRSSSRPCARSSRTSSSSRPASTRTRRPARARWP